MGMPARHYPSLPTEMSYPMLYRIDTPSGPVCDLIGPRLIHSWKLARLIASETHADTREPVTITRIGRSGQLSHALTIDRIR